MKIQDIVAQIRNNAGDVSINSETVTIRFYGLDGTDITINARELASQGSIRDFLESTANLDRKIVHEVLNRDYEYVDFDGKLVQAVARNCFNVLALQEAFYMADMLGSDVVVAGLLSGIGIDNIEDSFMGVYDSDEEFAEELFKGCYEIPPHLEFFIDWKKVTREAMFEYTSYNNYYFLA